MSGAANSVQFGWGAPKLNEQSHLSTISAETLEHFQKDADAISRLKVRGILPDSLGHKAYDRLALRIGKELAKANKS